MLFDYGNDSTMNKLDALLTTLDDMYPKLDICPDKEMVAVIHSVYDDGPKTVALVEVDASLTDMQKCERAFMLTNTIDAAWWTNDKVTIMTDTPCRSTSTGDQVLLQSGKKYTCGLDDWVDTSLIG